MAPSPLSAPGTRIRATSATPIAAGRPGSSRRGPARCRLRVCKRSPPKARGMSAPAPICSQPSLGSRAVRSPHRLSPEPRRDAQRGPVRHRRRRPPDRSDQCRCRRPSSGYAKEASTPFRPGWLIRFEQMQQLCTTLLVRLRAERSMFRRIRINSTTASWLRE